MGSGGGAAGARAGRRRRDGRTDKLVKSSRLGRSRLSSWRRQGATPDYNSRGAQREEMILREWFKGAKKVGVRLHVKETPSRSGNTSRVAVLRSEELNLDDPKRSFKVPITFE